MLRFLPVALTASALCTAPAIGQPLSSVPSAYGNAALPVAVPARAERPNLGGGFIEFLFGERGPQPLSYPPSSPDPETQRVIPMYANTAPSGYMEQPRSQLPPDPRYLRQMVDYRGAEPAGTIVIDTPQRFLFLVEGDGKAIRYGIGVGRPGFTWAGTHAVSSKKEWPDWRPPDEMLKRQPYLPPFMAGGPTNPLGARALYLGSTLYRIHGSNEPWTIGQLVSSGCIRMRNEDVIDLYERVKVGTKVVVI
jgi:lipoprotein-anchoring transpeptidase ErfK/SrfK